MSNTYSVKAQHGETVHQHNSAMELADRKFRTVNGAEKAASKFARAYDASAEIYDAHGSLVLRVNADGYRAP